ncbi:hypothetical protein [Halobellus rufus]|uniref:hypothetical protein n=1 Tax=Halobellus rufus TaxID=1448860 RepID=UPI0012E01FCF|nr:hypothetical protein [Halobellus rufus]
MMRPSRSGTFDLLLGVLLILLFFIVVAILALGITGRIDVGASSTVVSGLAALGTVALAGITLYTVRQNRRELDQIRKDRYRPLVIDEISNIVYPSIRILAHNIEYLDDNKRENRWMYHDGLEYHNWGESPASVISLRDLDPVAAERFRNDCPIILRKMNGYDWLLVYLSRLADTIAEELDPSVKEIFEQSEYTRDLEYGRNRLVILSSILGQVDEYGENSELYEFWEAHGDELNQLAYSEVKPLYTELMQGEEYLQEYSEAIRSELVARQRELQEEYGISALVNRHTALG